MHRLLVTSAFWLSVILSAYGESEEIPITTTNLDQYKYRFSVSTNAATNEVGFHITITAKREDIPSDSKVGLSLVAHTLDATGSRHTIEGVKPMVEVSLKKNKRVWATSFTVSPELAVKPGLCFVFTEFAHTVENGKRVAMPSADFYEIKLQDFLKP